jgi:hypothetical protein
LPVSAEAELRFCMVSVLMYLLVLLLDQNVFTYGDPAYRLGTSFSSPGC